MFADMQSTSYLLTNWLALLNKRVLYETEKQGKGPKKLYLPVLL